MIQHILPEQRPLGLFSPRCSSPSCPGSLSSALLRRRNVHCHNLAQQQTRDDVTPALAFDHALLPARAR